MAGIEQPPTWVDLGADEHVLVRARPSTNLVLAGLVAGVVLMVAMAVGVGFFAGLTTGRRVSFAVLILIVLIITGAFVVTKRHEYVLTSRRACSAVGVTDRRVTETPLEAVRDVSVEQSTGQRLFNVGTIRFVTDGGTADVSFRLVENPRDLQRRILQFVDLTGRN